MKAITIVLCCLPLSLFAQTLPMPPDAATARQWLSESIELFETKQYQTAEEKAESAYNFFHAAPDEYPEDLAEAAFRTGRAAFALEKYGGSKPLFIEAGKIWARLHPEGSLQEAEAWYYLSKCHLFRAKPDDALVWCKKAYNLRLQILPENDCEIAQSLVLMGDIFIQLGQYEKGRQSYENAEQIVDACAGENSELMADAWSGLGIANLRLGEFPIAIAFTEKAIALRQSLLPPDHLDLADSYANMGAIYKTLRNTEEALYYFEKSLAIRRKVLGENHIQIAAIYSEIGQFCLAQQNVQKALSYFEKENEIMIANKADKVYDYAYVCRDLGSAWYAMGDFKKACSWHEKMVEVWRVNLKHKNSQLASFLTILARSKVANLEFEAALEHLNEARDIWEKLFGTDRSMSRRVEGGMGALYYKWYRQTGNAAYLEESRAHFQEAETCIRMRLQEETYSDAQKRIIAESLPIVENAITTEMAFPEENPALENAWRLSESMHSQLLLASSQEANARHFAGIPDDALQQDSLLRANIAALYSKRQNMLQSQGLALNDSLVLATNARILKLQNELSELQSAFETDYPEYYNLKYQRNTATLEAVQQWLAPEQTLLEYFVGDSAMYIFVVRGSFCKVQTVPLDFPLQNWIKAFRESISAYPAAAQYEKMVRQYADTGQKLYAKLIAPVAQWISRELIIIPSENLSNLPFEALLSGAPSDLSNFGTYPFFLRTHTMYYGYSATMLQQMTARPKAENLEPLLAFAPFFDQDTTGIASRIATETRGELKPLPFSGEEVLRVQRRMGTEGLVLTGASAGKRRFLREAGRYRVLHLATHGKANHKKGEFSFLAFAGGDNSSALVSVGELYNLKLQAEMVVLSACETAIGETLRGEGVLSLARAFAYAGAKSVVASMWSVNDKSTMLLMDGLYAGLKAGNKKHKALAEAKRRFIAANPTQSHPFYWAPFVAVGDMEELSF